MAAVYQRGPQAVWEQGKHLPILVPAVSSSKKPLTQLLFLSHQTGEWGLPSCKWGLEYWVLATHNEQNALYNAVNVKDKTAWLS